MGAGTFPPQKQEERHRMWVQAWLAKFEVLSEDVAVSMKLFLFFLTELCNHQLRMRERGM